MHADNSSLQTFRQMAAQSSDVMIPLREEWDKAVKDNDPQLAKRLDEIGQFLFGDSWVSNGQS